MKEKIVVLMIVMGVIIIAIMSAISSSKDVTLSMLMEDVESVAYGEIDDDDSTWIHHICDNGNGYYGSCDYYLPESHCVVPDGDNDCNEDSDDSSGDNSGEETAYDPYKCPKNSNGHSWRQILNNVKKCTYCGAIVSIDY